MFKNLAAALIKHDRIVTTQAKAKEMRPLIEKLVHKAKRLQNRDSEFLKTNLRQSGVIDRLKNEVAPRFNKLPAGFTRIEPMGKRRVDGADMAMIEFTKNEYQRDEQNEIGITLELNDMMTFWEWENKLLHEEKEYYENQLRVLKYQIEVGIKAIMAQQRKRQVELLKKPIETGQDTKKGGQLKPE